MSAPAATPLQPRRGLLIVISLIFVIWVAAMIAMYLKTVYPQRHSAKNATTKLQ